MSFTINLFRMNPQDCLTKGIVNHPSDRILRINPSPAKDGIRTSPSGYGLRINPSPAKGGIRTNPSGWLTYKLTVEGIILTIRGQKVIIDSTLAHLYGVETKRLNEQVRRNAARFPSDFVFQLTAQEVRHLRSQFATGSSCGSGAPFS